MRRIKSQAFVVTIAVIGMAVASCATTAPRLPKQFVDLSPSIEPGYYSAMTVITMLNHLGSHHDALPAYPYLSGEAARYLASMRIKAFGTDMPGLMSIMNGASSYETAPVAGDAYLERIVGEPDIVFAGFPIKVKDGNGAPLRAVALVY